MWQHVYMIYVYQMLSRVWHLLRKMWCIFIADRMRPTTWECKTCIWFRWVWWVANSRNQQQPELPENDGFGMVVWKRNSQNSTLGIFVGVQPLAGEKVLWLETYKIHESIWKDIPRLTGKFGTSTTSKTPFNAFKVGIGIYMIVPRRKKNSTDHP